MKYGMRTPAPGARSRPAPRPSGKGRRRRPSYPDTGRRAWAGSGTRGRPPTTRCTGKQRSGSGTCSSSRRASAQLRRGSPFTQTYRALVERCRAGQPETLRLIPYDQHAATRKTAFFSDKAISTTQENRSERMTFLIQRYIRTIHPQTVHTLHNETHHPDDANQSSGIRQSGNVTCTTLRSLPLFHASTVGFENSEIAISVYYTNQHVVTHRLSHRQNR